MRSASVTGRPAGATRRSVRPERLAGQELHHDEPGVAVAVEVVEAHYVRMRDGLRLAELALQARDALRDARAAPGAAA